MNGYTITKLPLQPGQPSMSLRSDEMDLLIGALLDSRTMTLRQAQAQRSAERRDRDGSIGWQGDSDALFSYAARQNELTQRLIALHRPGRLEPKRSLWESLLSGASRLVNNLKGG